MSNYFLKANMTSTTAWSLIWSVYKSVGRFQDRGAMYAREPWSGHYKVSPTVWMYAHWTQVAQPGWRLLLPGEGGGSGEFADGTSYVTIVPPSNIDGPAPRNAPHIRERGTGDGNISDYSIIINRMHIPSDALIHLTLADGLPLAKPLHLWATCSETSQFLPAGQATPSADGTVTFRVDKGCIYSATTLTTVHHGNFSQPIPASAEFPLPYSDGFNGYANDTLPKYFADMGGSFSVLSTAAGNGTMHQMAPSAPGSNGCDRCLVFVHVSATDQILDLGRAGR